MGANSLTEGKHMTTKLKILGGFTLMIVLIAVLAVTSFLDTRYSAGNFSSYRELSRADVNLSNMRVSLEVMASNFYRYLRWQDKKYTDDARKALEEMEAEAKRTVEIFTDQERKNKVAQLATDAAKLSKLIDSVEKDLTAFYASYNNLALAGERQMGDAFSEIARQAQSVGNIEAVYLVFGLMDNFNEATTAMSRYATTRDAKELAMVRTNLRKC